MFYLINVLIESWSLSFFQVVFWDGVGREEAIASYIVDLSVKGCVCCLLSDTWEQFAWIDVIEPLGANRVASRQHGKCIFFNMIRFLIAGYLAVTCKGPRHIACFILFAMSNIERTSGLNFRDIYQKKEGWMF